MTNQLAEMINRTQKSNNDLQSKVNTLKSDSKPCLQENPENDDQILNLQIILHDRHNNVYVPVSPN